MATDTKRLYEGLFLVDSGDAAGDWDGVIGAVKKALDRGEAEIVSLNKWDDRRLTYEINGKARGTYILTYFNGTPGKIGAIEREVQLSERLLRVLMLRTDKMSEENIAKATPTMLAAVAAEAAAEAVAEAKAKAADEKAAAAEAAEAAAAEAAVAEVAVEEPGSDVTAEKEAKDTPDEVKDVSVEQDDSEEQDPSQDA